MFKRTALAAFAAALLVLAGANDNARAQGCLSQGEARAAVASGQAAPFSSFVGALRSQGDVVSSQLCDNGGRLVYVVNMMTGNGQVSRITIDARSGARMR